MTLSSNVSSVLPEGYAGRGGHLIEFDTYESDMQEQSRQRGRLRTLAMLAKMEFKARLKSTVSFLAMFRSGFGN
jgi:hypothetical protein